MALACWEGMISVTASRLPTPGFQLVQHDCLMPNIPLYTLCGFAWIKKTSFAPFPLAPCVPIGVNTFIQCENNIGSVSWTSSDGAVTYTAVAQGQTLGNTYICTTNTTVCSWADLLCGETYIVRVIASDLRCNSTTSDNTTIRMGETRSNHYVGGSSIVRICDYHKVLIINYPS